MAELHRSLSCPRCSGSMESGYILDEGYGTRTVAKWVPANRNGAFGRA
jgi:hypothetical protein